MDEKVSLLQTALQIKDDVARNEYIASLSDEERAEIARQAREAAATAIKLLEEFSALIHDAFMSCAESLAAFTEAAKLAQWWPPH